MREHPIIFSDEMVRAILKDRKTQTRRVMKPQPDDDGKVTVGEIGSSRGIAYVGNSTSGGIVTRVPCPYGQPGDRLWVKETWSLPAIFDALKPSDPSLGSRAKETVRYLADGSKSGKTRVSIHMPRWASRITLEIINVRVQRLQEISEHDAGEEGWRGSVQDAFIEHPLDWFRSLWNSINGPGAWDKNPWVWVIEFKRVAA